MFEQIEAVPPDPILGLGERFRADPRPEKLDLTVGVYKDETGVTPKFESVRRAEQRVLEAETTKVYLPIPGSGEYADQVTGLVFGDALGDRGRTTQSPGGTGALAVAARTLAMTLGPRRVWLSQPTWANHEGVFANAGHTIERYRYYRAAERELDFDAMVEDLGSAGVGDVVVLHGCCHNPTGRDPSLEQWAQLADLLVDRGLVAVVDLAYLGLARGLRKDAEFLGPLLGAGAELFVATSFSKNLGMYRERVGALTLVARDGSTAEAVQSNVNRAVRTMYSNPPSFGASVAATVLADPELRGLWHDEVAAMRDRLNGIRAELARALSASGLPGYEGLADEYGMFTLTGLTPAQVEWLREERAVYLVGSGRANVAGLDESTIPRFVEALRDAGAR